MDPDTIATLSELLSKGGNVALFVAVYVAWKAGGVAREAVQALKELRDAAVSTKPVVDKIALAVDDIDRRTGSIERTGELVHLKVSAALATTQKGV
jgi:hypothetical protein